MCWPLLAWGSVGHCGAHCSHRPLYLRLGSGLGNVRSTLTQSPPWLWRPHGDIMVDLGHHFRAPLLSHSTPQACVGLPLWPEPPMAWLPPTHLLSCCSIMTAPKPGGLNQCARLDREVTVCQHSVPDHQEQWLPPVICGCQKLT